MELFCRFSSSGVILSSFRVFLSHLNQIYWQFSYFLIVSLLGFVALKLTTPRTSIDEIQNLDLFFTSVSACTISSMAVVEMEVFSNTQLLIITLLMFLGGEVFSSFLSLHFRVLPASTKVDSVGFCASYASSKVHLQRDEIEKGGEVLSFEKDCLETRARKWLSFVIFGFLLSILAFGSCLILLYTRLVSSARNVLEGKGLNLATFSVFSAVSSFTNTGFIPTNENMMIFKENSGLLLMLLPLILLGNTLYPPFLRVLIWILKKKTKREEFSFVLKNHEEMGFDNMLSNLRSALLVATVLGFVYFQLIVLWFMEWNSAAMAGLSSYQKVVASLFQVVNSRHSGESAFDLSALSSAVLLVFVLTMYLPPYTTFIPKKYRKHVTQNKKGSTKTKSGVSSLIFSNVSCLLFFVFLICITERDKLNEDPLNFSVWNISFEVISAYGNIGFTTGYSCKRRINTDSFCEDKWYGFVGRWSGKGKFLLMVLMLFGRLKKYILNSGKAWVLK